MASKNTSTTFQINLKTQLMEKIANINNIVKGISEANADDLNQLPQLLKDINNYLEYQNRNLSLFSKIINLFFGNPGAQDAISLYKDDLEKIVQDLKELTEAKTMLQTIMTNIENMGIADEDKTEVLETLNEQIDKCFVNLELMLLSAQNMSLNSNIAPYQVGEKMNTDDISDYIYGMNPGEDLSVLSDFRNYLFRISEGIQKEQQNKAFLISIEKILDSVLIPMNIKIKVIKPILDAVTSSMNDEISDDIMKSRIAERLQNYKMNLSIAGTPGDFGIEEFNFPPLQEELKNILRDDNGSYFLKPNIIDDNLFQGIYRIEKEKFGLEAEEEVGDLIIDNKLGINSNARMNDLALILASFGHYKRDTNGIKPVKDFIKTIKTGDRDEANKIMRHLLYSIGSANKSIYYAPYILALIKASIGYNDEQNNYTNVIEILKARKNRLRIGLKGPVQMIKTDIIQIVEPEKQQPSVPPVPGIEEVAAAKAVAASLGEATSSGAASSAPATAQEQTQAIAAQRLQNRLGASGPAVPPPPPRPKISPATAANVIRAKNKLKRRREPGDIQPPLQQNPLTGRAATLTGREGAIRKAAAVQKLASLPKKKKKGDKTGGSRKRKSRKKSKKNKKKKGGKRKTKRKR